MWAFNSLSDVKCPIFDKSVLGIYTFNKWSKSNIRFFFFLYKHWKGHAVPSSSSHKKMSPKWRFKLLSSLMFSLKSRRGVSTRSDYKVAEVCR